MSLLRLSSSLPLALAAGTLAFAGCGDDSETTPERAEQAATPETALAEVTMTQRGVDEALAAYAGGDEAAAADQVRETYLQHFELVEGPLEEVDPELTEELEDAIREELVDSMEAGDPVGQVTNLVDDITAYLRDATKALQGS
jgi:hypothetical protein